MNRRNFLQFIGVTGLSLTLTEQLKVYGMGSPRNLPTLAPSLEDKFQTIEGINSEILISWGDKINSTERFGFNNDFLALHPLDKDRALLWVNHEYVHPIFIKGDERTKENIDAERKEVGGSIIEIQKRDGSWKFNKDSALNRRLDSFTPIPFAWKAKIMNSDTAIGTLAGCAGGYTPWGTFLSAEENYDMFWGDRDRKGNKTTKAWLQWDKFYPLPPEHYGWIVEITPKTGAAKKLVSLGRCAHECATVTKAKNQKIVAYTGDDAVNEHLYKFISDSENSLESGKLYVANLEKKVWMSLDINDQPILKKNFKDQTEIQIHVREAAKMLGATPLDRPEDIEIDPLTGNVFIALTNNKLKNNYHGSILKIIPENNDHGSLKFNFETFLTGGKENRFACPDNLLFDPLGNLWFTTDMPGSDIGKNHYEGLGNNSLFVFIRSGTYQGQILRLANAPRDAEITGPCFSPDFKTLFVSIQHPGEETTDVTRPTSTWPNGKIPKPSVVCMNGPLLDKIISGKL